MNDNKKLYTVIEAGEVLGVSKQVIYDLIYNNYLGAFDLCGLKIPATEINRFIADSINCDYSKLKHMTKSEYKAKMRGH